MVDVHEAVAAIIDDGARGDAALIELTQKYDRQTLSVDLRIGDDEIDAGMRACAPETKVAGIGGTTH